MKLHLSQLLENIPYVAMGSWTKFSMTYSPRYEIKKTKSYSKSIVLDELSNFKFLCLSKYLLIQYPKFFWNLLSYPILFNLPNTNSSTPTLDPFLSCSFLNLEQAVIIFFSNFFKAIFSFSALLPIS